MGNTLAIHWAATTHGTWLHGDPRGSWRGGRLIGPDPFLEAEARARMSSDAVILDERERILVGDVFGVVVREQQHCVLAASIQRAHVHLVVAPLRESIDTVIARFKSRSARAIIRRRREILAGNRFPAGTAGITYPAGTAGLYSRAILARDVSRHLWSAGKFPVFIFSESHLANAIEYVRDHNRRIGLPADPFDWISPLFPASKRVGERADLDRACGQFYL